MHLLMLLTFLAGCGETDADGDGVVMSVDCNDNNADVGAASSFFLDADGDTYGSEETTSACELPEGYAEQSGDCDDAEPMVNPGAAEICNLVDDDCDTEVDEGASSGVWYQDTDNDGFGDAAKVVETCDETGLVSNADDCDDTDDQVFPGGEEVCDGQDNDCDGAVDESSATDAGLWYADDDADGYGNAMDSVLACDAPDAYTDDNQDCDDQSAGVNPASLEICDGVDNDCDLTIDEDDADDAQTWHLDEDGDSYGSEWITVTSCDQPSGYVANADDCSDSDPAINPETWWYMDVDSDGYGAFDTATQGCDLGTGYVISAGDCNDNAVSVHPGQVEVCDEQDNDCDGIVDADATDAPAWYVDGDGDGVGSAVYFGAACESPGAGFALSSSDCDDTNSLVFPAADEVCDEVDNDCNGLVDSDDPNLIGTPTWYRDNDNDGQGDFYSTVSTCVVPTGFVSEPYDCDDEDDEVYYGSEEFCDGKDNDCDDEIDEDSAVDAFSWFEDLDDDNYGAGLEIVSCEAPSDAYVLADGDCNDADDLVHPYAVEDCLGEIDSNCDGFVGDADADNDGYSACDECDDSDASIHPGAPEFCNGIDDDCDTVVDNLPAVDQVTFYADVDGDGFGDSGDLVEACEVPIGYVEVPDDCDDNDANFNPEVEDECDGIDFNCDGADCDEWSDNFESASLGPEWFTYGNATWFVTSSTRQDGIYSAETGNINHSQTSSLEVMLDYHEAGTISFYRYLSTESSYDFLKFYVDGVQKGSWSGTLPWTAESYNVPAGVHTMKWVYSKDGSVDSGLDTVWIDVVVATGGGLP